MPKSTHNFTSLSNLYFTIGADGSLGLDGTDFGTPGLVLTSGGPGSPVFWAAPSGGSGGSIVIPSSDQNNPAGEMLVTLNEAGEPELCFSANDVLYAMNTN